MRNHEDNGNKLDKNPTNKMNSHSFKLALLFKCRSIPVDKFWGITPKFR